MKLVILGCGTSTGVPVPGCSCQVCRSPDPRNKRLRTAAVISTDDGMQILIDCSSDFRQQALRQDIRRVDAILFTHSHADHVLGLDDLRGYNYIGGPIAAYGLPHTLADLRHIFSYIFEPNPDYEGGAPPAIRLNEIEAGISFRVSSLTVQSVPLLHGRQVVSGYRIGNLAYATDCNSIPESSLPLLQGVKYLILDALRYEPHATHFTIPQSIEAARKIGAAKTIFVHMSHTVDFEEVNAKLPPGIQLAYDGMEVPFEIY